MIHVLIVHDHDRVSEEGVVHLVEVRYCRLVENTTWELRQSDDDDDVQAGMDDDGDIGVDLRDPQLVKWKEAPAVAGSAERVSIITGLLHSVVAVAVVVVVVAMAPILSRDGIQYEQEEEYAYDVDGS